MTKKVNKNASPKVGKTQNGISKNKGKTPDKKKLKEAAVKTPTTITALTPKVEGKKSKSKKEIQQKSNDDYVTFELGDTKRPKVGPLTKAEKRKLQRARKREAAKKKEESKDDTDEDEEESEVTVIENVKDSDSAENENEDDNQEEETEDEEEEEEGESSSEEVEEGKSDDEEEDEESDDDDEEEEEGESEDDSGEAAEVEDGKEAEDDSTYENETDSDSEPTEVKTEIKKKGIPNKETKKTEEDQKTENVKTNSEFTAFFRGFDIGAEEEVVTNFIHSAVDPEEIEHLFIAKKRGKKLRGFGFITLKTKEAYDKLLKLDKSEVGGKTIQMGKATFDPNKKSKQEAEKRKHDGDQKSQPIAKKQKNQFVKSDEATLCIKNIDFKVTDNQLREHFENAVSKGGIKQVRFPKRPEGGSRGFAFIEFTSQEALEKAKELNGSEFNGRNLVVQVSVPNNSPKRNSNDFSKFNSDKRGFRNNRDFNKDRKPFNKNKKFDGKNRNFQNNKGKFGRESKGKGNFKANKS